MSRVDMYTRFLEILRRAWHAHALFWGKDETVSSGKRSCVVLAPHPDDESIGMGATIARKIAEGSRVVLAVATDGRYSQTSEVISQDELIKIRKSELQNAAKVLGINDADIYFFDEIDTRIDDARLLLNFEKLIDGLDFKIEEILSTSWNDGHQDHRACAAIAKKVAKERNLLFRACPIYWWAEGPTRFHRGEDSFIKRQLGKPLDLWRGFFQRGFVVNSNEFSNLRDEAIKAYATQTSNFTGESTWSTLDPKWLQAFDRKREFFVES